VSKVVGRKKPRVTLDPRDVTKDHKHVRTVALAIPYFHGAHNSQRGGYCTDLSTVVITDLCRSPK